MKNSYKRNFDSLDEIFNHIENFSAEHHLDKQFILMLNLVVEELFTNAVKYNPDIPNDVNIEFLISDNVLTISIEDYTEKPFDLNKIPEYDIAAPLKDRPVGKLGILFIKNMFDTINHEYKNNQNKIILTKKLGQRNA